MSPSTALHAPTSCRGQTLEDGESLAVHIIADRRFHEKTATERHVHPRHDRTGVEVGVIAGLVVATKTDGTWIAEPEYRRITRQVPAPERRYFLR